VKITTHLHPLPRLRQLYFQSTTHLLGMHSENFNFASVLIVCTYEWAGIKMFILFNSKVRGIKIPVNSIY
jgi:hypothetical protein